MLDSMPHNAFPAASSLCIHGSEGHMIGRRLVTKMPVVKRIELTDPDWWSKEKEAVGLLEAVGGERGLECFKANCGVTDVGEGGLAWGDIADQLPTIKRLDVCVMGELPTIASISSPSCLLLCAAPEDLRDDGDDGDAAGEFGIACVRSLVKIRGIKELKFQPTPSDAFNWLVEERTHGDTIEGLEGRYDISWTDDDGDYALTLKPVDAFGWWDG